VAPLVFSTKKGNPMSTLRKLKKSIQKLPPIVIVPDKSYLDDTGHLIPTDVIVLTHREYHGKFLKAVYDSKKTQVII